MDVLEKNTFQINLEKKWAGLRLSEAIQQISSASPSFNVFYPGVWLYSDTCASS